MLRLADVDHTGPGHASSAQPRNRMWRTDSSFRASPSLGRIASPHLLGYVVGRVQDALRINDRQLFTDVQLLDECVGRNLYALLVAGVDTCHHHSVLSILQCLADGPGGARGLVGSSNRPQSAVTARSARTRSSYRAPPRACARSRRERAAVRLSCRIRVLPRISVRTEPINAPARSATTRGN